MTEETKKIRLVFAHRCPSQKKGQWVNLFYTLDSLEAGDPKERVFARKVKGPLSNPSPGAMFTVEAPEENTIIPATARWFGVYEDKAKVLEWSTVEAGEKAVAQAEKKVAKDLRRDSLLDALEPIRRAYMAARGAQRAQILAQVVKRITS